MAYHNQYIWELSPMTDNTDDSNRYTLDHALNTTKEETNSILIELDISYRSGSPKIPDSEFDLIEAHLRLIWKEAPYFTRLNDLTSSTLIDIPLTIPMLSLNKAVDEKEVSRFASHASFESTDVIYTEKLDGMSIELSYTELGADGDYHLSQAATRGSGIIGRDITNPIRKNCHAIPNHIKEGCIVRGELYLKKSDLVRLNDYLGNLNDFLGEDGDPTFANTRNTIPASISTPKNHHLLSYMSFKAFDIQAI